MAVEQVPVEFTAPARELFEQYKKYLPFDRLERQPLLIWADNTSTRVALKHGGIYWLMAENVEFHPMKPYDYRDLMGNDPNNFTTYRDMYSLDYGSYPLVSQVERWYVDIKQGLYRFDRYRVIENDADGVLANLNALRSHDPVERREAQSKVEHILAAAVDRREDFLPLNRNLVDHLELDLTPASHFTGAQERDPLTKKLMKRVGLLTMKGKA